MTDCGPGIGGNDTGALVTQAINNGLTFELWDKDEAPNEIAGGDGPRDPSFLYTGPLGNETDNGGITSGSWYWNATNSIAEGNTTFAMVLKDGSSSNDPIRWAWFLLDNVNTTAGGCVLPAGFTHCGTWSMYGNDGTIKDISHISIYGAGTSTVPNPGSLVLLGSGILGLGYLTRRKLTK